MAIHIASLGKRFGAHTLAACVVLGSMVAASPAGRAQTFTALYSFCSQYYPATSGCLDGYWPYAGLVQATDGNFYGTTGGGGAYGVGTVFKITPGGELTTLHSFDVADGTGPSGGLVQATDGNFYGTTSDGGPYCGYMCVPQGTVFRITPGGTLTTLYVFCLQGSPSTGCPDGAYPGGPLVQGSDGNLYGTTTMGYGPNEGTIFRITLGGTLTTLHSFEGTDGNDPEGGLVQQATDGNFYGTTAGGGAYGQGTVFKITPEGTLTTLYSFCAQSGCTDGTGPGGGVVQGSDGNFYGTTSCDGIGLGYFGTVFRITPEGSLTTLYSFCSQYDPDTGLCMDGNYPTTGLVQGSDGDFYGTTSSTTPPGALGFSPFGGTVFKITPGGSLTTLYVFCLQANGSCPNGSTPYAAPIQGTDGNFYGTTFEGGANSECSGGCGTVYKLSVGLGAFVETQPTFGPDGEPVIILGNDLAGATSVRFNGTAARFSVVSSTEIHTSVPKGARTGKVRVTTPSGTLTSNVPFRVTACAETPCMLPEAP
jgi:uncharacterized repeat protein (TIGR03803 family)